jgi:hypothetical protein
MELSNPRHYMEPLISQYSIYRKRGSRLGGGFASLRVVETFAVDGGDFRAHAAEVTGELAAMVNAVVHADLQEGYSGELEEAAEVGDLHEVIPFELRELVEIAGEIFGIPGGNFGGRLHRLRQSPCGWKFGVDGGLEEADLSSGDVADEFHGALGNGVGSVLGFVGGHGFEDFFGGAMLVFQGTEQDIVEPKFGEVGS